MKSISTRHSTPLLLGSYELELHPVIECALAQSYVRVIDIGCSDGYYAVGFAMKGCGPVIAFDADPRELRLCRLMAKLNGVEGQMTFRRWCSKELLQFLTERQRCFVLSDCEGYEAELFDAETVKALSASHVLIEVHGDAYGLLVERFSHTHKLRTIAASARSVESFPEVQLFAGDATRVIAENRDSHQRWLYAFPVTEEAPV